MINNHKQKEIEIQQRFKEDKPTSKIEGSDNPFF